MFIILLSHCYHYHDNCFDVINVDLLCCHIVILIAIIIPMRWMLTYTVITSLLLSWWLFRLMFNYTVNYWIHVFISLEFWFHFQESDNEKYHRLFGWWRKLWRRCPIRYWFIVTYNVNSLFQGYVHCWLFN